MKDLVSRQVAIRMFETELSDGEREYAVGFKGAKKILKKLPSAQPEPEIIRCCKCTYWQQNTVRQNSNDAGWWNEALCERHTIYGNEPHEAWTDAEWFCADAERRGEGGDK